MNKLLLLPLVLLLSTASANAQTMEDGPYFRLGFGPGSFSVPGAGDNTTDLLSARVSAAKDAYRTGESVSIDFDWFNASSEAAIVVDGLPNEILLSGDKRRATGIAATETSHTISLSVTDGGETASDSRQIRFVGALSVPPVEPISTPESGRIEQKIVADNVIGPAEWHMDGDHPEWADIELDGTLIADVPPGLQENVELQVVVVDTADNQSQPVQVTIEPAAADIGYGVARMASGYAAYSTSTMINDGSLIVYHPGTNAFVKWSPEGEVEWTKKYAIPNGYSGQSIVATNMTPTADGGYLSVGGNPLDGNSLAKFTANGDLVWHYITASHTSPSEYMTHVVEAPDGSIYVAGDGSYYVSGSPSAIVYGLPLTKFTATGAVTWKKFYQTATSSPSGGQHVHGLMVDSGDGVVVRYVGGSGSTSSTIWKISSTGAVTAKHGYAISGTTTPSVMGANGRFYSANGAGYLEAFAFGQPGSWSRRIVTGELYNGVQIANLALLSSSELLAVNQTAGGLTFTVYDTTTGTNKRSVKLNIATPAIASSQGFHVAGMYVRPGGGIVLHGMTSNDIITLWLPSLAIAGSGQMSVTAGTAPTNTAGIIYTSNFNTTEHNGVARTSPNKIATSGAVIDTPAFTFTAPTTP